MGVKQRVFKRRWASARSLHLLEDLYEATTSGVCLVYMVILKPHILTKELAFALILG
jgi:hypothetical protein